MDPIYTVDTFDFETYDQIRIQERKAGGQTKKKTGNDYKYKDCICAFDIETTTIPKYEQAVMYVFQFHIYGIGTIVGRTWDEFLTLCKRLIQPLAAKEYVVIYVHNLSYEFQFLRGVYNFNKDEVFAIDSRRVLKCSMFDHIEFRCSFIHSNMSLSEYTKKMKVEHVKLSGDDFDYSKQRYWFTPLTDDELQYCIHDVIGLTEALKVEMDMDGDDLYTIPMTSTGYVRRDVKKAMSKVNKRFIREQLPDYELYRALREAFRGGNTHANRYYVGEIIEDVHSYDRSSSYPDVQCNCPFPMSAFRREYNVTYEKFIDLMYAQKRAMLMRVSFTGVRLNDEAWGCPYIPVDKIHKAHKKSLRNDNGRVLECDYFEMTLTDIDFRIIIQEYEIDDIAVIDCWSARYGMLPAEMTDVVKDYYTKKTELKGNKEQEVYYTKVKNKLNSVYGMSAQNPVKQSINYVGGIDPFEEEKRNEMELLEESNKKAFFTYTWGVWTTAWARYRLEEGIRLVHFTEGARFLYTDTDSVKYCGTVDWTEYNKKREADSTKNKACAVDANGVTHYMGVYEDDGNYDQFITLGAKKYAYKEQGKDHIKVTVSGVNKKKGGAEIEANGGLQCFKPGFIFKEAGGTELKYNDVPQVTEVTINGYAIKIGPNVVIKDSTYTLGITEEYENILRGCDRNGIWI